MLRLLTFTNLYPNPIQPRHGIFVEHRLRRLVATGQVESRVIAPAPWCPLPLDGRYPEYRIKSIPARDTRNGIEIFHPRYWVVPGVTSNLNPWSMMRAALPVAKDLMARGYDFDVVDAQFIFPDGIAGVMLAKRFGKAVTLTARGSDVNIAMREAVPRRWLQWAMRDVAEFITVSAALKTALIEVGVPAQKINVIRNGVDLTLFGERNRDEMRKRLGLTGQVLLSVGNLVEGKGHHLAIEALKTLVECELLVIGKGPEGEKLRQLAADLGVASRVRFTEHVDQSELADYYTAADVTVLASSREGMANVLLESLACGTPVVATAVGGNPEVVADAIAGVLLPERTADAVIAGVKQVLSRGETRNAVRTYAHRFGWDEPIATQLRLFQQVAHDHRAAKAA